MRTNEISFRIRYSETDQMGVVYHGNYAQYLELARVEWLRSLGISYKSMEEGGIMLPVISLSIKYLKSAKYDDLVTVKVILTKKPAVRIEFDYEMTNEAGELLATANTVLVFMDMKRNRPTKCPQILLDKLEY
ncbi:MAG: thioesterase family protein [Maribacter dokdonensis]|uniref:Acyl-CoA thioester hydrolase n=1 Tax=Maribacter dokdonensis TaxID=320912 RepID=A0ABY0U9I2_9FLAO|nr:MULTISPECIES: thioesterase family protein [Maribacter]HAF78933.1 acyl-CoA thioesterase [Maribacter sp.]APA66174.1 thioesterase [Maribacter sp. 1_2014MBL_MicDiv]KSA13989.1 Thioesterase family protein [Maribacter dokdonensis DSW-8]MDP2524698.1 thioesterase family protein [Maribacter dokdonensis]CAG2531484.1 acyl-CoA thioester hydrolase [Maribacter dokdonensis]